MEEAIVVFTREFGTEVVLDFASPKVLPWDCALATPGARPELREVKIAPTRAPRETFEDFEASIIDAKSVWVIIERDWPGFIVQRFSPRAFKSGAPSAEEGRLKLASCCDNCCSRELALVLPEFSA